MDNDILINFGGIERNNFNNVLEAYLNDNDDSINLELACFSH